MEALIRDLVAAVLVPRPYAEVIEAWRTSCPRLTVWEDATDAGLIICTTTDGELLVQATPAGRALLGVTPPPPAAPPHPAGA